MSLGPVHAGVMDAVLAACREAYLEGYRSGFAAPLLSPDAADEAWESSGTLVRARRLLEKCYSQDSQSNADERQDTRRGHSWVPGQESTPQWPRVT